MAAGVEFVASLSLSSILAQLPVIGRLKFSMRRRKIPLSGKVLEFVFSRGLRHNFKARLLQTVYSQASCHDNALCQSIEIYKASQCLKFRPIGTAVL